MNISFLMVAGLVASGVGRAPDGAALYKSNCARCHGAAGEGVMGPSLQTTTLGQQQITDMLSKAVAAKQPPHGTAAAGWTAEQIAAVATYVGTLKK